MCVERGHVERRARRIGAEALRQLAVDDRAATVADEMDRRLEQLAAGTLVEHGERRVEGVGGGFGETVGRKIGLVVPVADQHHRAPGHRRGAEHGRQIGSGRREGRAVEVHQPAPGALLVQRRDAVAAFLGNRLAHLDEGREVARHIGGGGRRELEAVRQDGHTAERLGRILESVGLEHAPVACHHGARRRDHLDAPVILLAGGEFQRRWQRLDKHRTARVRTRRAQEARRIDPVGVQIGRSQVIGKQAVAAPVGTHDQARLRTLEALDKPVEGRIQVARQRTRREQFERGAALRDQSAGEAANPDRAVGGAGRNAEHRIPEPGSPIDHLEVGAHAD